MHWLLFIVAATGGSACQTPPPACTTTTLDSACLPQYTVTSFTNVYNNTIQPDCGSNKGSCHGNNGDSGISFADSAIAYDNLVANVKAGDPTCSELIVRTHDTGQDYSMPPDSPLGESERCALLQWVIAGTPP